MEILVRYLTKKRDGAIAARDERITAETVRFGRGTDNQVELAAPGVLLHEGALHRRAGGLFFESEGQAANHASIDGQPQRAGPVEIGSTIGIGPYDIVVLPPDEGFDIAVSVELVRPVGDSLEALRRNSTTRVSQVGISKRALSWSLLALVLVVFLAWPLVDNYVVGAGDMPPLDRTIKGVEREAWPIAADVSWITGEVSGSHKFIGQNCSFCHERPFVKVQDSVCAQCHADIRHHVDPQVHDLPQLTTALCQSCHKEHQGLEPITLDDEGFCADCHAELQTVAAETTLENASRFGDDHPEFRPTVVVDPVEPRFERIRLDPDAWPVERSNLTFTHKKHLNPDGILVPGQQQRRVMDCVDCHRAEPGGVGFADIDMERDCSGCHLLNFEPTEPTRRLPHGDVEAVVASLQEFYGNLALRGGAEIEEAPAVVRRLPGSRPLTDQERLEALAWAEEMARDAGERVFAKSVCGTCHQVSRTGDGPLDYAIAPVLIVDRWLPKGEFDHSRHSAPDCRGCHTAEQSERATDVLLPQIETCQSCHGGEEAAQRVPSTCVTCHDFHLDFHAPMRTLPAREQAMRE